MKKMTIVLLLLMSAAGLYAQDQETLFSGQVAHGGFGGPVITFSEIQGSSAVMVGGRGGWIINHMITLGGAGYGLVTRIPTVPAAGGGDSLSLSLGYGGFEVGYILNSHKLTHLSMFLLIGAGSAGHAVWTADEFDMNQEGNVFFVLEPSVEAVLNVTDFLRLSAGVSYRYISGLDMAGFSNSDFSGPAARLSLKFGSF